MTNRTRAEILAQAPLASLRRTRQDAADRGDTQLATDAHHALQIRTRSQTPEIENSGELFAHHHPPAPHNGWRGSTTYTGDPMAWMQHFMTGGQVARLNKKPDVVRRETVELRAGERIVIAKG